MYLYLYLKCISFRFSWSWSTLFSSHRTAFCWSSQKLRQQLKLISSFSSTGETFSSFSSTGEPFWFSLFSCNHLWRRHLVALDVISSAIHSLTSFESSLQQIFVTAKPANDLLFADTWTSYLAGTTPGWNLVGKSQAIKPSTLGEWRWMFWWGLSKESCEILKSNKCKEIPVP